MYHFCHFRFVFVILSCLFIVALWSPVGYLVCDVLLCFRHFPMWCPGSGVVLDCIAS